MTKTTSHIGVYGVMRKQESVLLVKKSRSPYKGLYDLQGGRLESGETHEQALIREVQEETGIVPKMWTFSDTVDYHCSFLQNDQSIDFHHIGHIFMIDEFDESQVNFHITFEDVEGCHWWMVNNLDELTPFAKTICS